MASQTPKDSSTDTVPLPASTPPRVWKMREFVEIGVFMFTIAAFAFFLFAIVVSAAQSFLISSHIQTPSDSKEQWTDSALRTVFLVGGVLFLGVVVGIVVFLERVSKGQGLLNSLSSVCLPRALHPSEVESVRGNALNTYRRKWVHEALMLIVGFVKKMDADEAEIACFERMLTKGYIECLGCRCSAPYREFYTRTHLGAHTRFYPENTNNVLTQKLDVLVEFNPTDPTREGKIVSGSALTAFVRNAFKARKNYMREKLPVVSSLRYISSSEVDALNLHKDVPGAPKAEITLSITLESKLRLLSESDFMTLMDATERPSRPLEIPEEGKEIEHKKIR